jgi:Holliday junction resolvase RusA-like endonuclease
VKLVTIIPGPPARWQRPRHVNGKTLTDAKMRAAKKHARASMAVGALTARWVIPTGPVRVELEFVRARKPDSTPDVDNLAKLPLDAANGLLWKDDAQVVELRALKRRPAAGEAEHTRVTVEVLS